MEKEKVDLFMKEIRKTLLAASNVEMRQEFGITTDFSKGPFAPKLSHNGTATVFIKIDIEGGAMDVSRNSIGMTTIERRS